MSFIESGGILKGDEIMFKKIMVCLDGSELAEGVVPYAAEIARAYRSRLILFRSVYVSSGMSLNIPGYAAIPVQTSHFEEELREEIKNAETYLNARAELLKTETGLEAEVETVLGAPAASIVSYADNNDVDIITISTHGRSGLGRAFLGSTADYVLRQSGLPNLVIRPKTKTPVLPESGSGSYLERMLVCLDGSHLAEQILPYVTNYARTSGNRVELLQVIKITDYETTGSPVTTEAVASRNDEYLKQQTEKAQNYLANIGDSLLQVGIGVRWHVLSDRDVGKAIISFANTNDIGMIAMCTNGYGGLKRALFGSIADHILRNSGLPVLVIKPKETIT